MKENNKYRLLFFTRFFGEFIFYSLISIYLRDLGYDGTKIGTLLSLSPFIFALSMPFWVLIEQSKIQKYVLFISAVLIVIMQFLMLQPINYIYIVVIMIIYSFGRAPLSPSLDSTTILYCMQEKEEFATFRSYGSLGYIIAVVLGSLIYANVSFITITSISAILLLLFGSFSVYVQPSTITDPTKEKPEIKMLAKNYNFYVFLIAQILCFGALNLNNAYELLYLRHRGINTAWFGVITLIRVAFEIVAFLYLRKNKINYKYLFMLMPFLMISQSLIFFLDSPIFTIFLIDAIAGFASGVLIYANTKYTARIVRPRNVTLATYILMITRNLSTGLLILVGGFIFDYKGVRFIYLLSGIIFAITTVFTTIFFKSMPRHIDNKKT